MSDHEKSYDEIVESSLTLKAQTKQILDLFENTLDFITSGHYQRHPYFFKIFKFFTDNANEEDEFLLNGLNRFLAFVKRTKNQLFKIIKADEFRDCLKSSLDLPLFQKSSQFWDQIYYLMKEAENSPQNKRGIRLFFNDICDAERPLASKSLTLLQKAHDCFEEYECCEKQKKFVQFYLNELLIVTNDLSDKELFHSDLKSKTVIENTRMEIARLLKCLFGFNLRSRLCDHQPSAFSVQGLNRQLIERILDFYIPESLNFIDENGEEIDGELTEICEKLHPLFEILLSKKLKDGFQKYFVRLESYFPNVNSTNNSEMQNLDPHEKLESPFAVNISDESRLVFAKACFVLMHSKLVRKMTLDPLILAKETLMFGRDLLDQKILGNTWFFIACLLVKEIKNPEFDVKTQYKKVLFPFYMSLFYDKEKAKTHVLLASTLYGFFLRCKSLSDSPNDHELLKLFKTRFKLHVTFATTYIQIEKSINNIVSIMHGFSNVFQANLNQYFTIILQNFFKASLEQLSSLIKREIQHSTSYSNNYIEKARETFLNLVPVLKNLYPLSYKETFEELIEDLRKNWKTVAFNQPQQNFAPTTNSQNNEVQILSPSTSDKTQRDEIQILSSSVSGKNQCDEVQCISFTPSNSQSNDVQVLSSSSDSNQTKLFCPVSLASNNQKQHQISAGQQNTNKKALEELYQSVQNIVNRNTAKNAEKSKNDEQLKNAEKANKQLEAKMAELQYKYEMSLNSSINLQLELDKSITENEQLEAKVLDLEAKLDKSINGNSKQAIKIKQLTQEVEKLKQDLNEKLNQEEKSKQ